MVPVTFNRKDGEAAVTEVAGVQLMPAGQTLNPLLVLMVGVGPTAKICAFETAPVDPLGAGFTTVMSAVPADVSRLAVTSAVSCVALT